MYPLLSGLRVVEGAAFVAGPLCGLHLHQMGAEVIRFDTVGGGPDFTRWPRAENGVSLYWEGLNKGKKSVAIDLSRPEGRELAQAIAAAPGEAGGLFVTNYPLDGFLSHSKLAELREDIITVRVMGWADGTTGLDYTINAAVGIPMMTGPASMGEEPVNHVLPAWDLTTGTYAAFALLAALRHRGLTGRGQEIRVPLSDVAMSTLGHLGQIAEVALSGAEHPRLGNDVFGAFGRDFATADGKRVMIVALTPRHWSELVRALGLGAQIAALEAELGISFARDEGLRFRHRDRLAPLVTQAIARFHYAELRAAFAGTGVCWGPYHTLGEALAEPALFSEANPLFETVAHPSGTPYLTPGTAATLPQMTRDAPGRAPRLGEHTDEVLAVVLGLPEGEIARLHDRGLVAGPAGH